MKVSLICTTLNEGTTIACLIDSILTQSRLPEEVVFVDAGSTDETLSIIKQAKKNTNLNIKLIKKKTNRSQGRNLAIQHSSHDIIVVTDAGCVLNKHWLERITKPLFEDRADSVAGFYLTVAPTLMSKSLAPFVAVMPSHFDPLNFLPSSRSIAFTKEAWAKVKGYPEDLEYCEDLVFAHQLKENTRMLRIKSAFVCWRVDTNLKGFFNQIKNYALGDIKANYKPHIIKNTTIFLRYALFIVLPPLLPIYFIWAIAKRYQLVNHPSAIIYLPVLQITSDLAIIWGTLKGLVQGQSGPTYTFNSAISI